MNKELKVVMKRKKNNQFKERQCSRYCKYGKDLIDLLDQQKSRKSVVVLSDSMTKQLIGCKMSWRIKTNCKIFIKTYSEATTTYMEDYMKSFLWMSPYQFILHSGINDLASTKWSQEIATSIINLACQLKTELHDVSVHWHRWYKIKCKRVWSKLSS